MVRAAFAERNDVINLHLGMGKATCCADAGGTNLLHIVGSKFSGGAFASASVMFRCGVYLLGTLGIILTPIGFRLLKSGAIVLAVGTSLLLVILRLLGPCGVRLCHRFSRVFSVRAALSLSEELRVFGALAALVLVEGCAILRSILSLICAALLSILRAPSGLIGLVAFLIRRSPQLRALARFDLSFFCVSHGTRLPRLNTANNYAA